MIRLTSHDSTFVTGVAFSRKVNTPPPTPTRADDTRRRAPTCIRGDDARERHPERRKRTLGMSSSDPHALPKRERALFSDLVECYETKKYERGVGLADEIIAKHPNHGETLAMKGLIVRSMDDSEGVNEEAHALIKRGIECHPRSHVCWHVLGLVHRQERNHAESAKCYANALKIDPDNALILKDLSMVYLQLRNVRAFVDLRWKILRTKPEQRTSYVALAVGLHLLGDHENAYGVIDSYEAIRASGQFDHHAAWREEDPLMKRFDKSELTLFKATLKKAAGLEKEALELLEKDEAKVVDKVAYLQILGSLQVSLGMKSEAEETYWNLLDRLPDSYDYHKALRAVRSLPEDVHDGAGDISDADIEKLGELYGEIRLKCPYSAAGRRLPLSFTKAGPAFTELVNKYIEKPIRKGVPSLFEDLKDLYENPAKAAALETIFINTVDTLKSDSKFPSGGAVSEAEKKDCVMYATNLLAMHYDEMAQRSADGGSKEFTRALDLIEEAIAMDPKCVELYLNKARFLEHAGDLQRAADVAEECRKLDLADRYLNSFCVRQMMLAGKYAYGEQLAAMFARDGDQATNLYDMEATWFELAAAKCHIRGKKFGRALKYYHAVLSHFQQFVEDQFDFHGYCLRRSAVNSYLELLKVEDKMYAREEYREAAKGAITLYVDLFDEPPAKKAAALEAKINAMPKDEADKFRQHLREVEEREAKAEEDRLAALEEQMKIAAAQESKNKSKDPPPKKVDPDPVGAALENSSDPLAQAMKFVEPLLLHAASYEETQLLAFEVFLRQEKPILALKTINETFKIDPNSIRGKRNVARLAHVVESMDDSNAMKKVLSMQVSKLTENRSSSEYAAALDAGEHPLDIATVAFARYDVMGDSKSDAPLVEGAKSTKVDASRFKLTDYVAAYEMYANASETAAETFAEGARGAFPRSTILSGAFL